MMKNSIMLTFALCLALIVTFGEAKATLLAVNDLKYGSPGFGVPITLDTATGSEWLNMQITSLQAPSFSELQSWLSPGGKLSGWELASAAQVYTLMGDAGLPSNMYGFRDTTELYSVAMTNFQNHLGALFNGETNPYFYTWGIVSDSPTPGQVSSIMLGSQSKWTLVDGGFPSNPEDYYLKKYSDSGGVQPMSIAQFDSRNWAGADPVGAWLVRPAPVPEPSSFILFGAGLAGVSFLRRRNHK